MNASIPSAVLVGAVGHPITVEVQVEIGLQAFRIVGPNVFSPVALKSSLERSSSNRSGRPIISGRPDCSAPRRA